MIYWYFVLCPLEFPWKCHAKEYYELASWSFVVRVVEYAALSFKSLKLSMAL